MRGKVGGALSKPANRWSAGCGATTGAASAAAAAITTSNNPRRVITKTACLIRLTPGYSRARGINDGQRHVREERAAGEKQGAGAGATRHEVDVAGAQRLQHQASEPGPRRGDFHCERSAEQRANRQAVDGRDRPQRRLQPRRASTIR